MSKYSISIDGKVLDFPDLDSYREFRTQLFGSTVQFTFCNDSQYTYQGRELVLYHLTLENRIFALIHPFTFTQD